MYSIRFRLIVFFVLVTTVSSGAFGLYAQFLLSHELETGFAAFKQGMITRLKINLPAPLWGFDRGIIERIVEAEMPPREVRAIYVYDPQGQLLTSISRSVEGQIVRNPPEKPAAGEAMHTDLYLPDVEAANKIPGAIQRPPLGHVVVHFSREHIDAKLRSELQRRIIEVLTIDMLLIVALTISLRMVFDPLKQLREALRSLATHEGEELEELPPTRRREFDDVIDSFNQTLRKLKQIIWRRSQAEAAAQAAAEETKEALEQVKAAQADLVKAEKLASLGALVAGIAHELNTPIGNGLLSITTMGDQLSEFQNDLKKNGLTRKKFDNFLISVGAVVDISGRALHRAAELVASFKQLAVDQTAANRRRFQVRHVVEDVLRVLHPTLKHTPYVVTTAIPDDLEMDSFPGALGQVLTNLVNNSVIHGFDGRDHGTIRIVAEPGDPEHLHLTVSDDGKGIAAGALERIFDPFFTTKMGQGGSGLGLHIAHNAITQVLGGSLKVSSQPGIGTEFRIILPCKAPLSRLDEV